MFSNSGNKGIIMKRINCTNWEIQGFNATPLLVMPCGDSGLSMKKDLGFGYSHFLYHFKGDYCEMYYDLDDLRNIYHEIMKRYESDNEYFKKEHSKWLHTTKEYLKKCKKTDYKNLTKYSDNELIKLANFIRKGLTKLVSIPHMIEGFDYFAHEQMREAIASSIHDPKETDQVLATLLTHTNPSFITKERDSMSRIKEIRDPKSQEIALKKHAREFFYTKNSYADASGETLEGFKEELRQFKKSKVDISSLAREKNELLKRLNLPESALEIFRIAEFLAAWHDERKEYTLQAIYYMERAAYELADRFGIDRSTIKYLNHEKINLKTLKAGTTRRLLAESAKECMFYTTNSSTRQLTPDEMQRVKEWLKQTEHDSVSELKGMGASPGTASGIVRVCKGLAALKNVQEGDILVASMTRPEFVPAMKKAAAIVTDEGGITCHAAILSRELGVPCVIGTRLATKILKDGMNVEVDGSAGTVKIIDRPNSKPANAKTKLFDGILNQLRAAKDKPEGTPVLIVGDAWDERCIKASEIVIKNEYANVILLGDKRKIEAAAKECGCSISKASIIDPEHCEFSGELADKLVELRKHKGMTKDQAEELVKDINYFGCLMLMTGRADGFVGSAICPTGDLMKPALQLVREGIANETCAYYDPKSDRIFFGTDSSLNIAPDANIHSQMAVNAAEVAQTFGFEPKVGFLSFSTKGSGGNSKEIQVIREAVNLAKAQKPDAKFDGEFQFDAAFNKKAAKKKCPDAEIAGKVNVMVFPDLNSGNIFAHSMLQLSDLEMLFTVISGLKKPVTILGRTTPYEHVENLFIVTAHLAGKRKHQSSSDSLPCESINIKNCADEQFEKFTAQLKSRTWWSEEAPSSVQTLFHPLNCFIAQDESIPKDISIVIEGMKDNTFIERTRVDEKVRLFYKFVESFRHDESFLDKLNQAAFDKYKEMMEMFRIFSEQKNQMSGERLWSLYRQFHDKYVDYLQYPAAIECSDAFSGDELANVIRKELSKISTAELNDLIYYLSAPKINSFMETERIEILKLSLKHYEKVQEGELSSELQKKLEEHSRKYAHIRTNYRDSQFLGVNDFFEDMTEICKHPKEDLQKEIALLEGKVERMQQKKEELIDKHKISEDLLMILSTIERMSEHVDERKYNMTRATNFIHKFCEEFAGRLNYHVEDVKDCTLEELESMILSGREIDFEKIKERRKLSAYVVTRGADGKPKSQWVYGERAKALLESTEYVGDGKTIKGQVASAPKSRHIGRAQVVMNVKQADFKQGRILVTSMTRPEFVPLMRKASAIVTDEGGITCHAAIVSREMGIPCIIGTKVATKVIPEGSELELDLNEGTVSVVGEVQPERKISKTIQPKYEDYVRAKSPIMTIGTFVKSIIGSQNFWGIDHLQEVVCLNYEGSIHWYQPDSCNLRIGMQLMEKLLASNSAFGEYERLFLSGFRRAVESTQKLRRIDVRKVSDRNLIRMHRDHSRLYFPFFGLSWQLDGLDRVNYEILSNDIRMHEKDEDLVQKYTSILSKYSGMSFLAQADFRILHAARALRENNLDECRKICRDLEENYYWVKSNWEDVMYLSRHDFEGEARAIAASKEDIDEKIRVMKKDVQDIKNNKEEVLSKLHNPQRLRFITEVFNKSIHWHDLRKESQMRTIFIWSRIYYELARRYRIEPELIEWAWLDELEKLVETGKINRELLKSRSEKYCAISYATHFEDYVGDEVEKIIKKKEFLKSDYDIEELKGTSASPGRAEGKAVVSYDPNYLNKNVSEGDILVTSNTTPAYLPAMKKAAAIITDEGGITCHAAIVARELGKPCVTGLKVATKAISTGDKLIVDADKAVVRVSR